MGEHFWAYSITELFHRADVRLLLWLNHFAADHSAVYKFLAFATDHGSDLLVLTTLMLLWFWPVPENNRKLLGMPVLGAKTPKEPLLTNWREWLLFPTVPNDFQPFLSRQQSRAQVLLFGIGGILAYIIARIIAFEMDVSRPFTTYWPVLSPIDVPDPFGDLRKFGSFPSDHAAMLGGFATAMYFWNRRLGALWTGLAVFLCIARVAVGFHYPMDMLVGACVGASCVWLLLRAYRARGAVRRWGDVLSASFEMSNAPYCYLMYFLVMLVGLEAAMHFEHLLQAIFALRWEVLASLGRNG